MRLLIFLALLCLLVYVTTSTEQRQRGRSGGAKNRNRNKRNVNAAVNAEKKPEAVNVGKVPTPTNAKVSPWAGNEKCAKFEVRYAMEGRSQPPVALIMERGRESRLGRIKRAIERSTGVVVQQVKSDQTQAKSPDTVSPLLRVVPFHKQADNKEDKSGASILLLRNPLKATFPRDIFRKSKNVEASRTKVAGRVKWWLGGARHWIRSDDSGSAQKFLLIQADQFSSNPQKELERVHAFLDVPVDKERLDCVLEDLNPKRAVENLKKSNQLYRRMWGKLGIRSQPAKILKRGVDQLNKALAKRAGGAKNAETIKLHFEV